jgi:hypothetical protein
MQRGKPDAGRGISTARLDQYIYRPARQYPHSQIGVNAPDHDGDSSGRRKTFGARNRFFKHRAVAGDR